VSQKRYDRKGSSGSKTEGLHAVVLEKNGSGKVSSTRHVEWQGVTHVEAAW
jgi:hypothetical protein